MSFHIPERLAQHVDQQAERLCCSRAAFIRRLLQEDMERIQANAARA